MEMGTKYDSMRSCPPYVSAIMQRYRITYDQSRPNSREGGGYPNGSEGIRKTWWRIDRELERSRNLAEWKKQKRKEREKRRKGKIEEGRSRRSQLSAIFLPFDRSSLSRRFFHRRIYFRWYQSREKIPAGISSPAPPPSMKSASVGPPTFSAIPSWSARPSIALHFFENVFPHHSSLSSFLSFFRSVFEQKRRHFSTDRPSLLFPFSFSRHLTLSRHLHEVVLRRREVNKGEAREGGGWRVLPGL